MEAAFAGVTTLFLGVERVVYLSFVGAAADATFTFARDHFGTEEQLRASGVTFTFSRRRGTGCRHRSCPAADRS